MKILGIDEAGRGPVCGPMIVCGYLIDDSKIAELRNMGVRDSKLLSPERREAMAPLLRKIALDFMTLKVEAEEIDTSDNLNRLEIGKMQHIINALDPDMVIIDSPEVNTRAFSKKIRSKVSKEVEIVSENYADRNHPEVAAASIIAKTERDREIRKLHHRHGYFGSGYPSDEITVRFLKDWIKKNKEFPPFVRRSWFTAHRLRKEKEQKTMNKFLKRDG